jgi:hypothetical protein
MVITRPGTTFSVYKAGTPVVWLQFLGHLGDERFPARDPRQREKNIGEHFKYEGGLTGPCDKVLKWERYLAQEGAWGAHLEDHALGMSWQQE